MRVCFLSFTHQYYDTRILHKEALSLAEAGFDVIHLAPGVVGERCIDERVDIQLYPSEPGLWGRIRKYITLYRCGVKLDADVYHCNEPESWLVGCVIKWLHRDKCIVFDVHEHYPSRFVGERYPFLLGCITRPLIHLLYRILSPWTDYLIFAKRSVASDFHGVEKKSSFIFNYGLLRMKSRQRSQVDTTVQAQFQGLKVAVHVGDFSLIRGWLKLLQALALMEHRELHVFCYGSVNEGEGRLIAEAKRLNVEDRIHLYPRLPFDEMYDRLLCSDIGLMLYQPGILNHVYAFPMKMYDYMLAGLPLLAPDFAIEVTPVIDEEDCGLLVDTSNSNEIAKALDWFCENPQEAREMGKRGRQAIISKYNWEAEAEKLIRIYNGFYEQSSRSKRMHSPST